MGIFNTRVISFQAAFIYLITATMLTSKRGHERQNPYLIQIAEQCSELKHKSYEVIGLSKHEKQSWA